MKNLILNSLIFLRLVDAHDNTLSLTNIAMIVVLTKLAMSQTSTPIDIGGLMVALLAYTGKKMISKGTNDE